MAVTLGSADLRHFRSLRRKQDRILQGSFLVEGPQAVREALRSKPEAVSSVLMTKNARQTHSDLLRLAEQVDCKIFLASDEQISRVSEAQSPQGVVAIADFIDVDLESMPLQQNSQFVLLHEVSDPGNLGNITRTADAAGVGGIFVTTGSVDIYNPKVVRASTGSVFNVPIVKGVELERIIEYLKSIGLIIVAADVSGGSISDFKEKGRLLEPLAWLFGNEARGLGKRELALADEVVSVPIFGKAESLSLQTAAAICIYQSSFAREDRISSSRPLD